MKYLFFILLSLSVLANAQVENIYKKYLQLFGLESSRALPLIQRSLNFDIEKEVQKIRSELNLELKFNYYPNLVDHLSSCESDCFKFENEQSFYQTQTRKHCLPYTNCEYYKCMEQEHQCKKENNMYFSKLAYPTCSQYRNNINAGYFSKKGIHWIYNVMVCLQKGLTDYCEVDGSCPKNVRKQTCDGITEFTLSFHPGCYLDTSVGICNLPLKDQANIWRTVRPYLTPREKQEAYKVIKECVKRRFKI